MAAKLGDDDAGAKFGDMGGEDTAAEFGNIAAVKFGDGTIGRKFGDLDVIVGMLRLEGKCGRELGGDAKESIRFDDAVAKMALKSGDEELPTRSVATWPYVLGQTASAPSSI